MEITPITVEGKHYLRVGELYVSTERKSWGYATSLGTCGNGVGSIAKYKSAQEVAEYVACPSNYKPMLAACKRIAAPIPQWYIDRHGTGME